MVIRYYCPDRMTFDDADRAKANLINDPRISVPRGSGYNRLENITIDEAVEMARTLLNNGLEVNISHE